MALLLCHKKTVHQKLKFPLKLITTSVSGVLQSVEDSNVESYEIFKILQVQESWKNKSDPDRDQDSYRAFPGATRWQLAWHQGIVQH